MTAVPTMTTSAGRGAASREHAMAGADQRDPAVDAEPVRMVVAVASRRTPRADVTTQRGSTSQISSCSSVRRRMPSPATMLPSMLDGAGSSLPCAFGELVDRLEEHRAVVEHRRARPRRRVQRPLEARVADVDREEGHRRTFRSCQAARRWPCSSSISRPSVRRKCASGASATIACILKFGIGVEHFLLRLR